MITKDVSGNTLSSAYKTALTQPSVGFNMKLYRGNTEVQGTFKRVKLSIGAGQSFDTTTDTFTIGAAYSSVLEATAYEMDVTPGDILDVRVGVDVSGAYTYVSVAKVVVTEYEAYKGQVSFKAVGLISTLAGIPAGLTAGTMTPAALAAAISTASGTTVTLGAFVSTALSITVTGTETCLDALVALAASLGGYAYETSAGITVAPFSSRTEYAIPTDYITAAPKISEAYTVDGVTVTSGENTYTFGTGRVPVTAPVDEAGAAILWGNIQGYSFNPGEITAAIIDPRVTPADILTTTAEGVNVRIPTQGIEVTYDGGYFGTYTATGLTSAGEASLRGGKVSENASQALTIAGEAAEVANKTAQHFWVDTHGVHITDDAETDWSEEYAKPNHGELSAPTNQKPWYNQLINSAGSLIRTGLINLASWTRSAIAFYDGQGNEDTNIVARFGADGAQIGKSTSDHVTIDSNGLRIVNGAGALADVNGVDVVAAARDAENARTNMLLDWNAPSLTKVEAATNRYFSDNNANRTCQIVEIAYPPEPGIKYGGRITSTGAQTNNGLKAAVCFYTSPTVAPMAEGQVYTLSFWARKVSGTCAYYCQVGSDPYIRKNGSNNFKADNELTAAWEKIEYQFTYTAATCGGTDGCRIYPGIVFKADTAGVGEVCGFKLVPGASPEQALADATAAQSTANSAATAAAGAATAASSAQTTANNAATAASNAQSTADGAQTTANNAASAAATADGKATAAQSAASAAQFTADEALTVNATNPNLSPYFASAPYNKNNNPYWNDFQTGNGYTFTDMGDGWVRIQATNNGSSVIRRDFFPIKSPAIQPGKDYTFLVEFRNNQSTGNGNDDFYLVQTSNYQFWGGSIKKNLEGANTSSVTYTRNLPTDGSYYAKRFVKTSEAVGSSHWTGGSIDSVIGLAVFTARCAAGNTIDYEVRVSVYEGEYYGQYKPYVSSPTAITEAQNTANSAATAAATAQSTATGAATAASQAAELAATADGKATATANHFWADSAGVHVSTDSGTAAGEFNSLFASAGLLFRKAANNLISLTSSALAFYDGLGNNASNIIARFGADGATIGRDSEAQLSITPRSVIAQDAENNTFFTAKDKRGADGLANYSEHFYGDGRTDTFMLSVDVVADTIVVRDGFGQVLTPAYKDERSIRFNTPPARGVIYVTAKSASPLLKNYVLGIYPDEQATPTPGVMSVAESIGASGGNYSHAEGSGTTKGNYSHAEGVSFAEGDYSHAEGSSTASGMYAHAEGRGTKATGNYSHAGGYNTSATGDSQVAIGKSNATDDSKAVIVGNGTDLARSNALTIDWQGNAWAAGAVQSVQAGATDALAGTVKVDSSQGISLDADGKLQVGGRLGQYPSGGVYYPTTIEPTGVGGSAFLMTDGAKGLNAGGREFCILAGANLTVKSTAAGSTVYRARNTQGNRTICFAAQNGFAAIDQADAAANGTAHIESIVFANGDPISFYFGQEETDNDIIITLSRSVNPSAATTKLRLYGNATGTDVITIGQGTGSKGGKVLALGQSCFCGGNQNMALGNGSIVTANNSVALGHTHLVNKQFCFAAGQGHDFTNAGNGTSAVGIAPELGADTAFAVGNGTFDANGNTTRSNALEVTKDGGVVLKSPNGTRWKIKVDNSGNLTTTAV